MPLKKKICPLLSKGKDGLIECLESKCAMYVQAFTTEDIEFYDCSFAMLPNMVKGQYRV